jgi:hypothetical protein
VGLAAAAVQEDPVHAQAVDGAVDVDDREWKATFAGDDDKIQLFWSYVGLRPSPGLIRDAPRLRAA